MLRHHREPKVVNGRQLPVAANRLTPEQHAAAIRAAWKNTVGGVFDTGSKIDAMFEQCAYGEIQRLIDSGQIGFKYEMCRRLRQIALDERLRRIHSQGECILPSAWTTLFQLSCCTDALLDKLIKTRALNPELRRRVVEQARNFLRGPKPKTKSGYYPSEAEKVWTKLLGDFRKAFKKKSDKSRELILKRLIADHTEATRPAETKVNRLLMGTDDKLRARNSIARLKDKMDYRELMRLHDRRHRKAKKRRAA